MRQGILNRSGDARRAVRLSGGRTMHAPAWLRAQIVRIAVANSGAAGAEYAFLIAFIAILGAIGMVLLGDDLQNYFQGLATAIENASTPTPDAFAT